MLTSLTNGVKSLPSGNENTEFGGTTTTNKSAVSTGGTPGTWVTVGFTVGLTGSAPGGSDDMSGTDAERRRKHESILCSQKRRGKKTHDVMVKWDECFESSSRMVE